MDEYDSDRFLLALKLFNSTKPIGSIKDFLLANDNIVVPPAETLVDIICYCLNPNHYHFILFEKIEGGLSMFMKRFGGFSYYFNLRHKRSGSLFAGQFKAKHIASNEHLLHASSYVNLNDQVHGLYGDTSKLVRSSWDEYKTGSNGLCKKEIIIEQFGNHKEYEKFATGNLPDMKAMRKTYKELKEILGID